MNRNETRSSSEGLRAVVYVRVSTDAQESDGTSLDTQERACVEFAEARGWALVRIVRDASSGYYLERPGLEEVRAMVRHGDADVVLAYALDRLARQQNHMGILLDEMQQWGHAEKYRRGGMAPFYLLQRIVADPR